MIGLFMLRNYCKLIRLEIIKFGCLILKSSYPKRFARFLSQMELVKTNEMVAV